MVVSNTMDIEYPIAEIFTSIQGEGHHAGRLMTFIRFAGCSVGKPYTPAARSALGLNTYQERCTDWSGTGFPCDTNYRMKARLSLTSLLEHEDIAKAERVLLTGGEPLMHAISPLIHALLVNPRRFVHIETSGTTPHQHWNAQRVWVAVSPKQFYKVEWLYHANEVKVLIGADFNENTFLANFGSVLDKVWVQPVNSENAIDEANLLKCVHLVHKYPVLRLSTQLHKIWRVR